MFQYEFGFLQAWVDDSDYSNWQNCADIKLYESAGRGYSRLAIIPNYLHQPAPPLIVDISKNPGRRVVRNGFVEAVGAETWFGQDFWERSGANKIEVLAIDWAEVEEIRSGIVHIEAADLPFTDESPIDIQHRLRKLLYPRTWNIPIRWKEWDGWKPINLPKETDADGYYLVPPNTEVEETFPMTIEMPGEKDGVPGRFRLTRKSPTDSEIIFIADKE